MSVVAIGTSLPEIGSHITASFGILSGQLNPDVISSTVIGGNMGSSTVQQVLFVGILFVGIRSREYKKRFFIDTYLPMLGTFVLVFGLAYDGLLSRMDGVILLVIFLGFMVTSYQYRERSVDLEDQPTGNVFLHIAIAIGGLTVVVGSAYFTLIYVERIVENFGLNGSMVGVLSIGFAGALPVRPFPPTPFRPHSWPGIFPLNLSSVCC
jgi:cation:H+ antiporter